MALFGKSIAIASVGISCQTAFQIHENADFIAGLVGEPLEKRATPFDWTVCAARDVAEMIRDKETYPKDIAELSGNRRPLWARRRCWFWHRVFETPEKFFGQARYERERWGEIGERPYRHFFVSNTQNNLARHVSGKAGLVIAFLFHDLSRLRAALSGRFGEMCTLHVVSHETCHIPYLPGVRWHKIATDGSQWSGSKREWRKVFQEAFAPAMAS